MINSLEVGPLPTGHILLDFEIHEWPLSRRKTVAQQYGIGKFPGKDDYVIVGVIKRTTEHMVVPPELGNCTFGLASEPRKRPSPDHINNPAVMEIINGSTPKKS